MPDSFSDARIGFGTLPVFLTTICTILGTILFLRMGYAVGHVGFWGAFTIIIIGHLVTIPAALAVSEIATNQRVEGGGAYHIVSRSFGLTIGGTIGIALYLSQAISVAFYVIAFSEAFNPVLAYLQDTYNIAIVDNRIISLPTMVLLSLLMLYRGANVGMKALYGVALILFVSIAMVFMGNTAYEPEGWHFLNDSIQNGDPFFYVFTIIFPAFTGIIVGLGLSGDLKNPKRSIPLGTISATLIGMVVYIAISYKLSLSASPTQLANNQLFLKEIAVWGPIVPIGLACATLSSALGSIFIAPRTLQALGDDRLFMSARINQWLSFGRAEDNEPFNASLVTCIIAFLFVLIGDIDQVAKIISMIFMLTYGSLCLISFLEHFAADPSYRPTFRSRWYISLLGAVLCFWLMFKMNTFYASLALIILMGIYLYLNKANKSRKGLAEIFQGAIFQLSRELQVYLQKTEQETKEQERWRPSIVCISDDSFHRYDAFKLLSWLSHRYGFGTYIHYIKGYYSKETQEEADESAARLIKQAEVTNSNVYIDTLISPSYTTAIAQIIQLPGVSGEENNMLLFEFEKGNSQSLTPLIENYQLMRTAQFDIGILRCSKKAFGYQHEIHIWLTAADYKNANLMILIGYIILGHPTWRNAVIKIFAIYPHDQLKKQKQQLLKLIESGRLPISAHNINVLSKKERNERAVINEKSQDADLTILGFNQQTLHKKRVQLFDKYEDVGNILFLNANRDITID